MRAERKLLSALLIEVREAAQHRAEAMIQAEVNRQLGALVPKVQGHLDGAVLAVRNRFEEIERIIFNRAGDPNGLKNAVVEAKREGRI
jgi:hypothetical protein